MINRGGDFVNHEDIKTFVKLCEIKNFTKTAEALAMSQPTVSLHIKNLEKEFQTQLIQRSPKHLSITPTGEILLQRATQILQIYEQIKQDILEHHQAVQGELKIGASFTIGEYILPSLLVDLKMNYPELVLQVIIGNTEEIVEHVKQFKVDIGLIEGKTDDKSLSIFPFMQDELVLIAPKSHPLVHKKTVDITDLQNEDWISREVGSGTQSSLYHFLHSNGLKVNSIMTISSNQGIKEAVIKGIGLTLLSKNVVERDVRMGDIAILQLKNQHFFRTLSYIYSPVMLEKGNVKSFIKSLNNKWRSGT